MFFSVYELLYADPSTHHMGFYPNLHTNGKLWQLVQWFFKSPFSYSSHLKYEAFGPSLVSFLSLGFRGLFIHLQHTIGCLQALLLTTNSICYLWTPSFVWHCEKEKLNHLVFSSYIHVSQKEGFFPQVMGYRNYQDAFSQMRWHQSSASMSFFSQFFRWVWKVSTLPLRTEKKSSLICCRYEISR